MISNNGKHPTWHTIAMVISLIYESLGDFKDAFWPTETATSRAAYCSRQAPGSANGSMSVNTDGNKKKSGKGNSKGKTKESKKNKNK